MKTQGRSLNSIMTEVTKGLRNKSYGNRIRFKYKMSRLDGKKVARHRKIAQLALGKPLPPKAVVHHFDLDPSNNEPTNLIVCQDIHYLNLIVRRTKEIVRRDIAADLVSRLKLFK